MDIEDIRRANLERLIKEKYKNQTSFVRETGVNQGETSGLLNKKRPFGERKARKLEKLAGLPVGWFDTDHDYETTTEPDPKPVNQVPFEREFRIVPMFNRPKWNAMEDMGQPLAWLMCPYKNASEETYAMTVRDDAMLSITGYNSFTTGDIVFVDPALKDNYKDKDFVLATSSHFKMASIKQYIEQDARGFLYTSNPTWQTQWIPIEDDKTIEIHGVIVAKITVTK